MPELKKRKADSSAEIIDLEQKLAEQEKEKAEPEGNITVFPLNPDLDRFQQFETIMTSLFRQTLKEELENRISDSVIHGMDVLMQLKEEKEEERFRRLDETIRLHQKNGTLVAAAREPGLFRLFRRKKKSAVDMTGAKS